MGKHCIKKIAALILIISTLLIFSCNNTENQDNDKEIKNIIAKPTLLDKIKKRGKLIAVTDYNSTNYFVYRGTPMGYQYELLKLLADHLDVKLDLEINNDLNSCFGGLKTGKYDIISLGLTVTKERNRLVDFTIPITQTRQVLVQRKPDKWRKMRTYDEVEHHLIRNPLQLAGKTINIQKNTTFHSRLKNLSDEIGSSIFIIEDPDKEVEELIADVVNKDIDYTICDEHIALVNEKYYPDIDVKTPISFQQNIAWAIKKGDSVFLEEINNWLANFNKSIASRYIYNKYFKNPRSVYIAKSQYHSISGGKISRFDEEIKKHSEIIDWDWRLLASLIYQESQFQEDAKSWVGAFGLMQLMPNTANKYGVDSLSPPEEQIEAGVKFLSLLDKQFVKKIENTNQRKKFVLASYNAGIAHVYDARRLAEKNNKDPNIWDGNVDYYLLNKSKPEFYRDSIVKYGYCRGEETYNFVSEIFERYEHYKNVIKN
ncbi:MAG: transporter substrate-binding domain-containing protein [Bacteroidales bacterium]|nr:transporter substrate-binding domain-containing protein [Bacteroidales bacterium]